MESKSVVLIGGGFAGLSAAVGLAERGFRVTVLERKPALGGRAYSFVDPRSGDFVDNGQHVLMGCYHSALGFLRRIGTSDNLVFHRNLEVEMLAAGGRRAQLRSARVPGPFHMVGALLKYSHLAFGERLRLLSGGARLLSLHRKHRDTLEHLTVAGLMDQLGQSEWARQCFWYPLTVAALNDQPEACSAALLAEVLKRGFFSRREDSAFVYSRVGLSDLYCKPAADILTSRAGMVVPHALVESLELGEGPRVGAVKLRDGRRLRADYFISAVPPPQLLRFIPERLATDPYFSRLGGLDSSPIICVHLWLDQEVTQSPFVGFIGTTTQWLFNKRRMFASRDGEHPGYLSFVISGARDLVDLPNEDLLARVTGDLRTMIPAARNAKVVNALVLKEKFATMAPDPKSQHLRPPVTTPINNFFLAGDWIQTGLPATIESAAISADACVAALSARAQGEY